MSAQSFSATSDGDQQSTIFSFDTPQHQKHKKVKKGIDIEQERRNRNDRTIQIRKEKRADRTNLVRKMAKLDKKSKSSETENGGIAYLRGPGFVFFKQKCSELNSPDLRVRIEATIYMRRILSSGKFPPVELLFESNEVIRHLCEALLIREAPLLQLEAAWCVTNLACGESEHLSTLITHDVIGNIATVMMHCTGDLALLQQCIWALCNLSSDPTACQTIIEHPVLIVLILQHMGIHIVPDTTSSFTAWFECTLVPRRLAMRDNPSLAVMRHVTFILSNIIELRTEYPQSLYECILFTLIDLIHSPDDEILLDISQTVYFTVTSHTALAVQAVALGFPTRLREIYETSGNATLRELSLAALCAIVRSLPTYQSRMLLLKLDSTWPTMPFVPLLLTSLTDLCRTSYGGDNDRYDVDVDMATDDDGTAAVSSAAFATSGGASGTPAAAAASSMMNAVDKEHEEEHAKMVIMEGKATIAVDAGFTKRDVVSALRAIVALPDPIPVVSAAATATATATAASAASVVSFRTPILQSPTLWSQLECLITRGTFPVKVDAGHLFLDLVELASYRLGRGDNINQWQMLFAMTEVLMMLSDGQLVSRTLHVLEGVFQKLLADDQGGVVVVGEDLRGVLYEHAQAEFGRSLGLVAMRPDPFQSRTAEHIHDMLDTVGRFDG